LTKKKLFPLVGLLVAAVLLPSPAGALDLGPDLSPFVGGVLSVPFIRDSKNDATAVGLDANFVAFVFNGGLSVRHWSHEVESWDEDERRRNELTGYLGLGVANLLQAQAGLSGTGVSLRLRSDIVLFGDEASTSFGVIPGLFSNSSSRWGKWGLLRQGIVFSPFVETSPWSSNKKFIWGVGLGVSF
jgi:hypothetical protein